MFIVVNAIAALVPLLVGFIWYNPMAFGKAWMSTTGLTQDSMKGANMAVVFLLTYVFSFFLAFVLTGLVVHQLALYSILANDPGIHTKTGPGYAALQNFLSQYQGNFRTYKHGAFHGLLFGLFAVLPIIGVNALFERKSWKYIFINVGFWTGCTTIMGAIICHWSPLGRLQ